MGGIRWRREAEETWVSERLPGSELFLLTVIANGQNRCVEIGVKANYLTMDTTTIPCGSGVGSCYLLRTFLTSQILPN